jgi:hypothetical protein
MDWARRTFQKPMAAMDKNETFEKIRTWFTYSTMGGIDLRRSRSAATERT